MKVGNLEDHSNAASCPLPSYLKPNLTNNIYLPQVKLREAMRKDSKQKRVKEKGATKAGDQTIRKVNFLITFLDSSTVTVES